MEQPKIEIDEEGITLEVQGEKICNNCLKYGTKLCGVWRTRSPTFSMLYCEEYIPLIIYCPKCRT